MKPNFPKLSLLFVSAILCLITCKTPVNNKVLKGPDKVDTLMNKTIAYLKANGAEVIEIEFPKGENYGAYRVPGLENRSIAG
jgi:Asp-tRNA(Asn)/Glu-tRNA(Gln) amidotransferase A subunit family amidase